MTERVLPLADGASACPFVAFEDDRDERATVPDHRHRCYAEPRPAPRALAHQEAYCLSSAFPVCPIFQDWARREAARARSDTARNEAAATRTTAEAAWSSASSGPAASVDAIGAGDAADRTGAAAGTGDAASEARATDASHDDRSDRHDRDADDDEHDDELDDGVNRRNPPRDWAAPPPWLASRDRRAANPDADAPGFLGRRTAEPGRGLAGSAADRLAGGPPPAGPEDDVPWTASGASAAAGRAALGGPEPRSDTRPDPGRGRRAPADDEIEEEELEPRRPVRRTRAYEQHLGGTDGPDWERPRRHDAYPTIKTRVGMPNVPRLAVLALLVVVIAVGLYFLPAVLGLGAGSGTGKGSPAPSSAAQKTARPSPTVPPAPTPSVYTIKKGETLSKIATAHGITIEELLAANPTIKDANKISEGQQIILPVPSDAPPDTIEGSAQPSAP